MINKTANKSRNKGAKVTNVLKIEFNDYILSRIPKRSIMRASSNEFINRIE